MKEAINQRLRFLPELYFSPDSSLLSILGFATAFIIGMFLGLLGGGGAILTLPVLIYLFGMEAVEATSYSLLLVGITVLGGVFAHAKKGNINREALLQFGIPSVIGVWMVRKWILPAIPENLIQSSLFQLRKDDFILILFSIMMVMASIKMIAGNKKKEKATESGKGFFSLALSGFISGSLTSLVGAGGGFIIIPFLHLYARLSMPMAVGTSVAIILINSAIAVLADLSNQVQFSLPLVLGFSALSLVGVTLGSALVSKINGDKLRKIFGWFVLVMGVIIFLIR